MVTIERQAELMDLWGDETSEASTKRWRDELNQEERALVGQWDKAYGYDDRRVRLDIIRRLGQGERLELNTYKVTLRHDPGGNPFQKDEVVRAVSAREAARAMQEKYPEMYVHEVYRKVNLW